MTPDHEPDQANVGFAVALRVRRRAAGLTQAELAARAGVGIRTVRDLERGRASRPQRTTAELLAAGLGLTGPELAEFIALARGQAGAFHPPQQPGVAPGASIGEPGGAGGTAPPAGTVALPPPVELVGRDRDLVDLAALLVSVDDLVTLVGLAGVGKSSLALAVIHHVADKFPGGVAGITISEVSSEADVLAAVASVFGVGPASDLAARFADAPALLLVDAVERSPGPTAEALRWLSGAAPALRVLATGRHPVGLPGERVWPVSPLEEPPADLPADLATVARYPAAALFLARLRQVRREALEPDEVGALIALVRRLGGLPLALELAAAWGRVLDLNEILDRYGDRVLDLSAAPPAGAAAAAGRADTVTLRDAVAASYRLLEPAERYALRRLSVFRNRWSIELAEALLSGPAHPGSAPAVAPEATPAGAAHPDTPPNAALPGTLTGAALPGTLPGGANTFAEDLVPLLDRLIALGLVGVRGAGPFRFRLLDVVRDFALEQAAATGELAAASARHAQVFAALAARIAPDLVGGNLLNAVARLDDVASDLWAALALAAKDDPHTALALAAALPRWWRFRGRDMPGRQWLRRLLDDPRTAEVDPAVRAWAKVGVAQLAHEHGAGQQELPAAEQALAEFQWLGDLTGELAARSLLCGLWMSSGGYDEARRHNEAVLALATRAGRIRDTAVAQINLTWHEIRAGDLAAARRRLAAGDRLATQCGDPRLRTLARANLVEVARLEGRFEEAVTRGWRVVALLEELGDPGHRRRVLGTIGLALAQAGRVVQAGEVLAELRGLADTGAARPSGEHSARPGDDGPAEEDGARAAIEANIALHRGDRELAAEWFTVAAQAYTGKHDLRDVAEALVGVVASTDDATDRERALGWLDSVCREGGITLVDRERALLAPWRPE